MPHSAAPLRSKAPPSMTAIWIAIFWRSDIVGPRSKSRRTNYMPQPLKGRRTPKNIQSTSQAVAGVRWSVALIAGGILLRFAIATISIGTNDAAAWLRFGEEINHHGLLVTYRVDRDFNHPAM